METNNFIEGLTILNGYFDNPDGFNISPDHEVIYVYATDKPVSPADLEKLVALGWYQEGVNTDGYEFEPQHYNQEKGWAAFF